MNMIKYEWTLETIEDDEIINNDFTDKLINFEQSEIIGKDLALVRDQWDDCDCLIDRTWAYVKDGKLPEYFTDSYGYAISVKVPNKFHNELYQYLNKK